MYETLRALRSGQTVEVEGIPVRMVESNLKEGDTYVAERNTGPHLLTVRQVNVLLGCIHPQENQYPFDLFECIKVEPVWEE